jgi:hypothetical protein
MNISRIKVFQALQTKDSKILMQAVGINKHTNYRDDFKLGFLIWGPWKAISNVNVSGIRSLTASILKLSSSMFVVPHYGAYIDVATATSMSIAKKTPVVLLPDDIKYSLTYKQIYSKAKKLKKLKKLNKLNKLNSITQQKYDNQKKYLILQHKKQSANIKYALSGSLRSLVSISQTALILGLILVLGPLSMPINIAIMFLGCIARNTACAFDTANQNRYAMRLILKYANLVNDISDKQLQEIEQEFKHLYVNTTPNNDEITSNEQKICQMINIMINAKNNKLLYKALSMYINTQTLTDNIKSPAQIKKETLEHITQFKLAQAEYEGTSTNQEKQIKINNIINKCKSSRRSLHKYAIQEACARKNNVDGQRNKAYSSTIMGGMFSAIGETNYYLDTMHNNNNSAVNVLLGTKTSAGVINSSARIAATTKRIEVKKIMQNKHDIKALSYKYNMQYKQHSSKKQRIANNIKSIFIGAYSLVSIPYDAAKSKFAILRISSEKV